VALTGRTIAASGIADKTAARRFSIPSTKRSQTFPARTVAIRCRTTRPSSMNAQVGGRRMLHRPASTAIIFCAFTCGHVEFRTPSSDKPDAMRNENRGYRHESIRRMSISQIDGRTDTIPASTWSIIQLFPIGRPTGTGALLGRLEPGVRGIDYTNLIVPSPRPRAARTRETSSTTPSSAISRN